MSKYFNYNEMLEDICDGRGSIKKIAERYGRSPSYVKTVSKKVESMRYKPRFRDGRLCCHMCGCTADDTDTFHLHHNHKTGKWIAILCRKCNKQAEAELTFIPKKLVISLTFEQTKSWMAFMQEFKQKNLKKFIKNFPEFCKKLGEQNE